MEEESSSEEDYSLEDIADNLKDFIDFPEKKILKDYKGEDYRDPDAFINKEDLLDYAFNLYMFGDFSASLVCLVFYRTEMRNKMDSNTAESIWSKMSWISIYMHGRFCSDLEKKKIFVKEGENKTIYYKEHCEEYLKFKQLVEEFDLDIKFPFPEETDYMIRI